MEQKVIIIVGPTCSGKTSLSLNLANKLKSQIISADSRQVYEELSIGTAKPSVEELNLSPHYLIDFLNPKEEYNASKFEKDALQIIAEIHKCNQIPIVVGGSGLYIRALIDGIFDTVDTDEEFREELIHKQSSYGNEYLLKQLREVDPKSAEKLIPQNWKRIIRALEVFHITGEPIWKLQQEFNRDVAYNFFQFGLNWNREILYKNIELRVDNMLENGLVDEVKSIIEKGYSKDLNSLNTVGYKEIIDYLEGNITLGRAVDLIKRNTRRYAKRQMTWFRKDERITWYDIKEKSEISEISQKIINHIS